MPWNRHFLCAIYGGTVMGHLFSALETLSRGQSSLALRTPEHQVALQSQKSFKTIFILID